MCPQNTPVRLSHSSFAMLSSPQPSPDKPPPLTPAPLNEKLSSLYISAFGFLPTACLVLIPTLLSQVTNFDLSVTQRQAYILSLLLSKRLLLYGLAFTTVEIASFRSLSSASEGLGQRLMRVNDEIFAGISNVGESNRQYRILKLEEELEQLKYPISKLEKRLQASKKTAIKEEIENVKLESAQSREAYDILNNIGGKELSLLLPIILLVSLLASFSLTVGPQTILQQNELMMYSNSILRSSIFSDLIKLFTVFSSATVCWLFSKCEMQNVFETIKCFISPSSSSSSSALPKQVGILVSTALVAFAYLHIPIYGDQISWVAQNIVNVCIAITFSRVIQINELKWVIVALVGVALYDYFGVLGSQQLTDGGKSVMEAVARAKANLPDPLFIAPSPLDAKELSALTIPETLRLNIWQPGLLQIAINGKPSDLLGLGDIIFPSLLASWSLRKDKESSDKLGNIFFRSSMFSYAIGCLALEVFQTGSGQPALLYLVPSMLSGLIVAQVYDKYQNRTVEVDGERKK